MTTGELPPSPATVRVPVMLPAVDGVTAIEKLPDCPGPRAIGNVTPERLNCGLESVACVILIATVPVFETETLCVALAPTATVPKLILLGFNWNSAAIVCEVALTAPVQLFRKNVKGSKPKTRRLHKFWNLVDTLPAKTGPVTTP